MSDIPSTDVLRERLKALTKHAQKLSAQPDQQQLAGVVAGIGHVLAQILLPDGSAAPAERLFTPAAAQKITSHVQWEEAEREAQRAARRKADAYDAVRAELLPVVQRLTPEDRRGGVAHMPLAELVDAVIAHAPGKPNPMPQVNDDMQVWRYLFDLLGWKPTGPGRPIDAAIEVGKQLTAAQHARREAEQGYQQSLNTWAEQVRTLTAERDEAMEKWLALERSYEDRVHALEERNKLRTVTPEYDAELLGALARSGKYEGALRGDILTDIERTRTLLQAAFPDTKLLPGLAANLENLSNIIGYARGDLESALPIERDADGKPSSMWTLAKVTATAKNMIAGLREDVAAARAAYAKLHDAVMKQTVEVLGTLQEPDVAKRWGSSVASLKATPPEEEPGGGGTTRH